jgi:hypothetical protein
MAVASGPHLAQNTGHLLSLLLGALVGAELPLGDLERALVLADLEQLGDAFLVGGEPRHLADQAPHEVHPLARLSLPARGARRELPLGHHMPLVDPHQQARVGCLGCHGNLSREQLRAFPSLLLFSLLLDAGWRRQPETLTTLGLFALFDPRFICRAQIGPCSLYDPILIPSLIGLMYAI